MASKLMTACVQGIALGCSFMPVLSYADMSLEELTQLSAQSMPSADILPARAQILSEAALSLGSRKGMAERAAQLIDTLEARASHLDRLYRFSLLMMKDGVLPPVITEARHAMQADHEQIRAADRVYRIMIPARLVTLPPSWRDYLFLGLRVSPDERIPVVSVLPKKPEERTYWKEQVLLGYAHGRELADTILQRNWAKLDRDYLGMLRYLDLFHKKMVTQPTVSVAASLVTGDKQQMNVGDTLYRLNEQSAFVNDAKAWQPIVFSERFKREQKE